MKRAELATPERVILLLSVIPYLREHGPTPLDELATAFDVSPRILRSLISFLGMAGIPGETATYQDEDLFDIDWHAFEEHDLVSLTRTVAVEDTPRFSALEAAALHAGVLALRPMLPESQHATIDSLQHKLLNASAPSDQPTQAAVSVALENVAPVLAKVLLAVNEQRQITFTYRDARGAYTQRQVDPLLLHQTSEQWYLRAWCHDRGAERTFALDQMNDIEVTAESFTREPLRPQDIPLFTPGAHDGAVPVEVRVTERGAAAISGFAPEKLTEPDAAGWISAVVHLAHPGVAVRLVQSLPGEVHVVQPESAVTAVADWVQLALVAYDE